MSESQTGKTDAIGIFKDLAVYLSKSPSTSALILHNIIAELDEEINSSSELSEEDKGALKYFVGKLVESYRVFDGTYNQSVIGKYITEPENLTRITQAIGEILRAYRLLVTEDLSEGSSVIEDIAHTIEDASALIESAVMSIISDLNKKLENSNCLQETQNS